MNMRRDYFEIFMKENLIGLLSDCVYYCWQHGQISDEDCLKLDHLCHLFYAKYSRVKEKFNEC